MRLLPVVTSVCCVVFVSIVVIAASRSVPPRLGSPADSPPLAPAIDAAATQMLQQLPVAFVQNLGQWEHAGRFVAKLPGGAVFLDPSRIRLSWGDGERGEVRHGAAVFLRLANANAAELVPEQRLAGARTYLLGNDATRWRDVPNWGAVRYRGSWPGVDLVCRTQDGHFEYDVALAAGADLMPVEFQVEGGRALHIDRDGALVIDTDAGPLRQAPPVTYQLGADGSRQEITSHYELRGEDRFGFVAADWDRQQPLLLDPGLTWSTYLGGTHDDLAYGVAVDAQGIVTVVGETESTDFPVTAGAWSTSLLGDWDAFVTRLDPRLPGAQQLLSSTYFGGASLDVANAVHVDASGVLTIVGGTGSANFPVTPGAYSTIPNGSLDAFVLRLLPSAPAAQQVLYATFLGGGRDDMAQLMAVDAAGIVTVAGTTFSTNFPTTATAWNTTYNGGGYDLFIARIDPSLPPAQQLLYATFLGGGGNEYCSGLSIDAAGLVTVSGNTYSANYPTTANAWNPSHNGGPSDAFVTELDPSRPAPLQLRYSTFLGGSGDDAAGVSVDGAGIITAVGSTSSTNLPTTPGAWSRSHLGGTKDVFVMRLDPTQPAAQQLLYASYLGGSGDDGVAGFAVDGSGIVTIAGFTASTDFPTTPGTYDSSANGDLDVFALRFDPSQPTARQVVYATLFGGSYDEKIGAIAVDAAGTVTIAGYTTSLDSPTTPGAWSSHHSGWPRDAFVARLDLLPTGVSAYGASTAGCAGPLRIGVFSWPQVGNAGFEISCANAPANSAGVLAIGVRGLVNPVLIAGAAVWIDVQSPVLLTLLTSNAIGMGQVPEPIPAMPSLIGMQAFSQFLWLDACGPAGVSASNALAITLQR